MHCDFRIEKANTKEKYEGLRALWCEVFKDEAEFADGMYEAFGANPNEGKFISGQISGYVVLNEDEKVVSALTCFLSGSYDDKPIWTSYAICTDPDYRGAGLAGRLVEHVRDIVLGAGGISLISPAEPSLEKFYGAHGYEPHFYVDESVVFSDDDDDFEFDEEDAEFEKFNPTFEMRPLDAAAYNNYRESFLSGVPHVVLSDAFMNLIHSESTLPDGSSGLRLINNGDAICALAEYPGGNIRIAELVVNPALRDISEEIDEELACRISNELGLKEISCRKPSGSKCQSMAAGITDDSEAYYGFPID